MSDDISIEELNRLTRKELDFQIVESKYCLPCKYLTPNRCYGHETRIKMLEESLQKTNTQESQHE